MNYLFINTLRNFSPFLGTIFCSFDNKLHSLAAMYWKFGSIIDWNKMHTKRNKFNKKKQKQFAPNNNYLETETTSCTRTKLKNQNTEAAATTRGRNLVFITLIIDLIVD